MLEHAGADRSFQDLWQDYSLGIMAFAQIAGVEPQVVRDMLYGHPVPSSEAQKVYCKVSEMLGARDTVENSAILDTTQEMQDEITHFLRVTRSPPPWQEE